MAEALDYADPSRASEYVFKVTRSEPRVTYWHEGEQDNAEEVNVPRAKRRLLKGLALPVRAMFTVDYIPAQVHVDPTDVAAGLEQRGDVEQRVLKYWKRLSEQMSQ